MRLGIDIGGTKTEAVVLDDDGGVLARVRRPTGFGAQAVVETVIDATQDVIESLPAGSPDHIEAAGVGVPGVVDHMSGRVRHAVNLGFDELDLGPTLAARLGIPVRVENDVNAAALGAFHVLKVRGSMGFLNLGTGLAAGIVVDGRLWRGASGAAGEIGHIPVDPGGVRCACGQIGCLETKASGSAIARMWPTETRFPAVDLFSRAALGERAAVRVRDEVADGIAAAVQMLALTADVGIVAIGGGVSNLGEPLREQVQTALERAAQRAPFVASLALATRVRMVPVGSSPAAVGAALAADAPDEGCTSGMTRPGRAGEPDRAGLGLVR